MTYTAKPEILSLRASNDHADLASGKGHRDENFPVASWLVKARYRPAIMAFYRFARTADDIADHETAEPAEKLALLAHMRAGLEGAGAPEAMALRDVMRANALSPVHAHELLDAFVRDVTVRRCADWDDLIGYCRLSAMPVGRFVLDVHGENRAIWAANDALCAALQIVNHLPDCGKDYRALDRVYIPLDTGLRVEDLGRDRASPELRAILVSCVQRTRVLLDQSAGFASALHDRRLAMEVAIIHRLASDLCDRLETRDPLSERVHHGKFEAFRLATGTAVTTLFRRSA